MKIRLLAFAFALLFGSPAFAANSTIEVWKSTTCQCCGYWVKHLEANGFDVKVNAADPSLLDRVRKDADIPDKLAACHTARSTATLSRGMFPAPTLSAFSMRSPMPLV
jgi:hypothetical protein